MSTARASHGTFSGTALVDAEVADDDAVAVVNCSRLGRTANPPRFSLGDLFRFGRWR